MKTKIKPLGDRVLVKRLPNEDTTAGGIIIPDGAKEKTQTGTILAVGTGRLAEDGTPRPLPVKEGQTIFFGKYSGTEVDNDHLIIREEEILGVVEN